MFLRPQALVIRVHMTPDKRLLDSAGGSAPVRALSQTHKNNYDREGEGKERMTEIKKDARTEITQQDGHTPPVRLGKKRLRKMRYQQQRLPPEEFLIRSARSLAFTGSVKCLNPVEEAAMAEMRQVRATTSTDPVTVEAKNPSSFNHIMLQPLLVLDLNGILCHRIRREREKIYANPTYRPMAANIANTPIIPRPDLDQFLTFLDQHFCLAIWTSAKNKTATQMIKVLFPEHLSNRLLFVWAQHNCDMIQNEDSQIYEKDLSKIWKEFPLWNSSNTILMDDSPEKCARWRENAVHPPPLNGQIVDNTMDTLISDEENVQKQDKFFKQLIHHWRLHPLTQDFELEAADAVISSSKTQAQFFREHACGHMGWSLERS